MYRVVSIVLAMIALAIVFFGLSLCDYAAACHAAAAAAPGGLAGHPVQVQRLMVIAGLLGFVGGVVGFLRGPSTLPPWGSRRGVPEDDAHAPLVVRATVFLGALFALAGIALPVLTFSPGNAPLLGFPYTVTLIVALVLAGYFLWHLLPHRRG